MEGQPMQTLPASSTPTGSPATGGDTKLWGILGYIFPFLFFVPLLGSDKDKPFVRFHANQQLNLLLLWVVVNVMAIVPVLGWLLMPIAIIFGLALMIIGIMNVQRNEQKPLPVIGKFELLK